MNKQMIKNAINFLKDEWVGADGWISDEARDTVEYLQFLLQQPSFKERVIEILKRRLRECYFDGQLKIEVGHCLKEIESMEE